jgi:hypothetical protein
MTTSKFRDPGPVRPRRPPRSRHRFRREAIGLLAGLAVGLALVFTLVPLGGRGPAPRQAASPGGDLVPAPATGPVPTALDSEWAAVSDQSTCGGWAGGDGISAVRLNAAQTAWFFSDSYLGPAGPATGFSHSAGLVHNSVVIQTVGRQDSQFVTLTGGDTCSLTKKPASVVAAPRAPGRPSTRYWAEGGLKVGGSVLEFYQRYSPGNVPYVPLGTVIADYSVAKLASAGKSGPADGGTAIPRLTALPYYLPPGQHSPVVWGAAVLQAGSTVYVYGTQTPDSAVPKRQVYLARVPVSKLTDFAAWQFSAGAGRWTAAQAGARPLQPPGSWLGVSSGFSVVQAGLRYWLVQANPIAGSQDIDAYPAGAPWGPFDQAAGIVLYHDPGIGLDAAHDYRLLYEARVEPAVSPGGALVISYNVNSTGNSAGCVPMSWFSNTVTLPRFVSVPLAVFSGAHDGTTADGVTAGPADYPAVATRDPDQWFNEWDYPDGCPPVPGIARVAAAPQPGSVTLSWPDVGLGLAYQVYLRAPGATGYVLRETVPWVLAAPPHSLTVTLAGLPPGRYQAKVVPLNLKLRTGTAAQAEFTIP